LGVSAAAAGSRPPQLTAAAAAGPAQLTGVSGVLITLKTAHFLLFL